MRWHWQNIAFLIAYFLSNISVKYYENPTMLSRVIAKNIGDIFFETQCRYTKRFENIMHLILNY